MSVELRAATKAEMFDLGAVVAYVYAGAFGDEADNVAAQSIKPEWTLCAFVEGTMASTFATLPMEIYTLGHSVRMGGITAVGTLPEFRRQGLVRKIMTQSFTEMRAQGQFVAGLWASQAAIYQRYGFSQVGMLRRYDIDTADIRFFDGNAGSATVKRHPIDDAFDVVKEIYRQFAEPRMGYVQRRNGTWRYNVLANHDTDGPLHLAIATEDNQPVGYLAYTVRNDRVSHPGRGQELKIRELVALTGNAYRSLWQFVATHDLVGRVIWNNAPMDDPAPELMMEPRMLGTVDREGLWLRLVDVAEALQCRGYSADGELIFNVPEDSLAPWNEGSWQLRVVSGKAVVTKTDQPANLVTPVKALASLFTGFRTASELAAVELIAGDRDTVRVADRIFAVGTRPHCPDNF